MAITRETHHLFMDVKYLLYANDIRADQDRIIELALQALKHNLLKLEEG